jgi:hypothetical protein
MSCPDCEGVGGHDCATYGHALTHVPMGPVGRLTPACTCGWWSPNWQHAEFERHIKKVREAA